MIFADTSYLIAIVRPSDENHCRAAEISQGLAERVIITDNVFSEFVTFLAYKDGNSAAHLHAKKVLESEILLVCALNEDMPSALELIKKYPKLSMCDALSFIVMKKLGIKKILSFDSDFDGLGCERIF